VNVRRPTEADFDEVLALLRRSDEAMLPESDWTAETLREYWDEFDPGEDAWIVELDGRLAGYVDFEARESRLIGDGYVDPALRNRGVGSELLRLTEERAVEELPQLEGRVVLQNATLLGDDCTPNLYERHGYAPVRNFWRMVIELDAEPADAEAPVGIEIRTMRQGEERAVHETIEAAFADHWQHTARSFEEFSKRTFGRPAHDPALYWVALEGDELVAASLCDWKREGDWGWVNLLGVRPEWRRRGIAEALLRTAFAEFFRRGERRVGLGVDAESTTGATRLYERVGMRVFSRIVVYEKELRAA
jgi:mycothiol synthase